MDIMKKLGLSFIYMYSFGGDEWITKEHDKVRTTEFCRNVLLEEHIKDIKIMKIVLPYLPTTRQKQIKKRIEIKIKLIESITKMKWKDIKGAIDGYNLLY